jgi:flagellar basal-body rod protein FlgC
MDLENAMRIASGGMKAQGERLRVISENIANADDTATVPGGQPYRRKTISFKNELDRSLGVDMVKVNKYGTDPSEFSKKYDPSHPSADAEGYVLYPNVNPITEAVDAKEAQRGYEANLNVIEVSKDMISQTLNLLH